MPYIPEQKPRDPGKDPEGGQPLDRKKIARIALIAFSCLLIGFGGFRLAAYWMDLAASRKTAEELRQVYGQTEAPEATAVPQAPAESAPPEVPAAAEPETGPADREPAESGKAPAPQKAAGSGPAVSERIRKLRAKSEYIIGWLSMDGVEEAVAQKDNVFFLDHDATGKKNGNGAIFLDEDISLYPSPAAYILYGHNMKTGNMFGRLRKYKESTYFFRHRLISFESLYEAGQYLVFAVAEISTNPRSTAWYDLAALVSERAEDRERAIRELEKRSEQNSLLDVKADDRILLLVTCVDGDEERLLVAARRLREGETEENPEMRRN